MNDESIVDLAELARRLKGGAADALLRRFGGKALGLARLIVAGLPVPPGFVAAARIRGQPELLARRAASLRTPVIVRSSATIEDGEGGAAPGIFASVADVTVGDIAAAARTVWESADSEAARAYAEVRGIDGPIGMAVIVQEQIEPELHGTLYSRLPGAPDSDHMLIEIELHDSWLEIDRRRGAVIDAGGGGRGLADEARKTMVAVALEAERAIGSTTGADVEWVLDGRAELFVVQARPIVHRAGKVERPPDEVFDQMMGRWVWDASHNPAPLSPAQESLVERVDAARLAPYRMKVVRGYLYVRDDERSRTATGDDAASLRVWFEREVEPRMRAILDGAGGDLASTLDAYDRFYELYAQVLTPRVSAARDALVEQLARRMPADQASARAAELLGPPAAGVGAWLRRAARGEIEREQLLDAIGDAAPEWDVACPTYRDDPSLVDAAVAARRQRQDPQDLSDPELDPELHAALALTRAARDIGEQDDLLYGRAQALVRGALLARAAELGLASPDDIFFVPLDMAVACQAHEIESMARARRTFHQSNAALAMPLEIRDGRPVRPSQRLAADSWQGRGTGGRATGPVVRLDSGTRQVPAGSIAVARTLTPAAAVLLQGAAAFVTEHGGLLGHAAAAARELGIPCVVGCRGIWRQLTDGERVTVVGHAGLVLRPGR